MAKVVKDFGNIQLIKETTLYDEATYYFKHKTKNYGIDREEIDTLMTYKAITEKEYRDIVITFDEMINIIIKNSNSIDTETTSNSIRITTETFTTIKINLACLIIETNDKQIIKKIDEYLKD